MTILRKSFKFTEINSSLTKIALINSIISAFKDKSVNLLQILIDAGYIESTKTLLSFSEKQTVVSDLVSYFNSSEKIDFNFLLSIESSYKLINNSTSLLEIINQNPELCKKFINCFKSKNEEIYPGFKTIARRLKDNVPTAYAKIHLSRIFHIISFKDACIENFDEFYYKLEPIEEKDKCLDVFLAGYPENIDSSFLNVHKNQIDNILSNSETFSNLNDLLFTNIFSFPLHICNQNKCFGLNNCIFLHDNSNNIFKITIFTDFSSSLISSVSQLDHEKTVSILLSELFQSSRHWNTAIYSLISNRLKMALKSFTKIEDM